MAVRAVSAQTVETPVPFDSARRVLTVTPAVADRLKLLGPTWPVTGVYREVRLYSVEPGGDFVLVVQLPSGAFQRFSLTSLERQRLGAAIDSAWATSGRPTTEAMTDVVSQPAGNAFAVHQTLLAASAYGSMAASLSDDGRARAALYLLTTGGTFFVSYGAAQHNKFTRAQSDLAGDLGFATGVGGLLLGYAVTGEWSRGVRGASVASALAGTVAGAAIARRLSDGEAHAATLGVEIGAVTSAVAASAIGRDPRSYAAASVVGGLIGLPIGIRYPRIVSYSVTAGDVEAAATAALVGTLASGIFLTQVSDPGPRATVSILGTGYLAGALVGDLAFSRPFNLSQSQANMLKIGAGAGALLGAAIPTIAGSDNATGLLAFATGGAVFGIGGMASTFKNSRVRVSEANSSNGARFSLLPAGVFGAATRTRGAHPIMRIEF